VDAEWEAMVFATLSISFLRCGTLKSVQHFPSASIAYSTLHLIIGNLRQKLLTKRGRLEYGEKMPRTDGIPRHRLCRYFAISRASRTNFSRELIR
jgi:hypothetical protein